MLRGEPTGEVQIPAMLDPAEGYMHDSNSTSFSWPDHTFSFSEPSALETPSKRLGPFVHDRSFLGKHGSILYSPREVV